MNKGVKVSKILFQNVEVVYQLKLDSTMEEIDKIVNTSRNPIVKKKIVRACLKNMLQEQVWRICNKTFVYEFHEFRKKIGVEINPSSSLAFDRYLQQFDSTDITLWFKKYPILYNILDSVINNCCNYIIEVLKNLKADYNEILTEKLLDKNEKLEEIIPFQSDPHNGSKRVLSFKFTKHQLLYKPRSLAIDKLMGSIFTGILNFQEKYGINPIVRSINIKNHGWQLFIKSGEPDEEEIGKKYFNLGLCSSVFSVLGASDMHDENIIFNHEKPYFIDIETSFNGKYDDRIDSIMDEMNSRIKSSIASTSIIPAKLPSPSYGALIGAINTPYPQKIEKRVFYFKNFGTDATDIARQKVMVIKKSSSIFKIDNKVIDPIEYQRDFLEGYECGFKELKKNRRNIIQLLSHTHLPVRVVIRPTNKYFTFLEALLFPENLTSATAVSNILKYLKQPLLVHNGKVANQILTKEKHSLLIGDIPYFYLYSDEKEFRSSDFKTNKVYDITPIEAAIKNLINLDYKHLLFDKRLIAEGFSEIRIKEREYKKNNKQAHYESPLFLDIVLNTDKLQSKALTDVITTLAIEKRQKVGWVGGVYGDINYSYASTEFCSLHDTGGILFLYEHLKNVNSNYRNLYKKSLQGSLEMFSFLKNQKRQNDSIISGPASLIFVYDHDSKSSKRLENTINHSNLRSEGQDIFNGLPGIALAISSFSEIQKETLENLKNIIFKPNFDKNGLAHGTLGLLWSKFRISRVLNKEDCEEIFNTTINQRYEEDWISNGWCNGLAGLLMIEGEMAKFLNKDLSFLNELAKKCLENEFIDSVDFSVCHGVSGVIQSFLYTYKLTNNVIYLTYANKYLDRALKAAGQYGFYTGENGRDYLLGYVLGWSGFADTLFLLEQYNKGNKLWIPINISTNEYQLELEEK